VTAAKRRQLVLVAAVLGSLILLLLGVFSAMHKAREHEADQIDHEIAATADHEAQALESYFERARSIDLLIAQNPAFSDFYHGRDPNPRSAMGPSSEPWNAVNEALAYLERLYPYRIGEACFIDRRGFEIARVVRGEIARPNDLAPDESGNPFFGPTFALAFGQVYQAAPYVSPDTGEWVISNSTLLPSPDGTKRAIVHFEVTIESFRREAAAGARGQTVLVVDRSTGGIVFDSMRPQEEGSPLGTSKTPTFRSIAEIDPGRGVGTIDGQHVAYASIRRTSVNANDWVVIVPSPPLRVSPAAGLDPSTQLMIGGSMILMALAAGISRGRRRELKVAATTDPLTGLPNRALFADRVEQSILRCRREATSAAVMMIDLNGFKEINDTLGHPHGDKVLRAVSQRLRECLRESDTVARLGGDEFGLLLPSVSDLEAAIGVAERVTAGFAQPIVAANFTIRISASIGIAMYPDHGEDFSQLIQYADVAMYGAKEQKVPFTVYSSTLDPFSRERLGLLVDLPQAIEERELILHFQPKVDLPDEQVTSVEALVRWPHRDRGLIPPDEFIPLAEEIGMIDSLTSLVLDLALEQLRAWHDEGVNITVVAVNIPARSLLNTGFPAEVEALLEKWGLPASALVLELTESAFLSDPERAITTAERLRAMGAAVSIDDFGTGYSSLAYLRDLPVDELKIDRSFISRMLHSDSDALIVRSAIVLAHGLGLRVVAEGVERSAELEELVRLECDSAQGFLMCRPLPGRELSAKLRTMAGAPGKMASPR
jgi:diguanylate cyclase (GGDEF)-like protein